MLKILLDSVSSQNQTNKLKKIVVLRKGLRVQNVATQSTYQHK